MNAVRFFIYSDADFGRISQSVEHALNAWVAEWLVEPAQRFRVSAESARSNAIPDAERWMTVVRDGEIMAAFGAPACGSGVLEALVTGLSMSELRHAAGTEIARELCEESMRALGLALTKGLSVDAGRESESWAVEHPTIESFGRPGAAWVICRCAWTAIGGITVLLSPEVAIRIATANVSRRRGRDGAIVGKRRAVEGQALMLDAALGEAVLDLGELQSLAVGDVIRLDRRMDEPLLLRTREGDVVCGAHVGTVDERRSVQLVTEKS